jgi:hypothetical protein
MERASIMKPGDHSKRLENPTDLVERTETSAKGCNESKAGGRIVTIASRHAVVADPDRRWSFGRVRGRVLRVQAGRLGEVDSSHLVH